MGSSGRGRFENYSERSNYGLNNTSSTGMYVSSNSGNASGQICPIELNTIKLEDIQISQYYTERNELPSTEDEVFLSDQIHNGRLVVRHTSSNLIIGNLPTSYNYMIRCLANNYTGNVISSGMEPIPFVVVNLHA